MNKTLILFLLIALMLVCTGCTVQFKAEKLELEGHTNTSYEFQGFAWTEPQPELQNPTDRAYKKYATGKRFE